MYTIDGENNNQFEEEEYSYNNFWDNNKGLIIKIIIIILCIIVLVWLFKALKTKRNTVSDENVHIANVEKVRLAAEKYYFIDDKKKDNEVNVVSLSTLKSLGLTEDIVDANNKVCSEKATDVTLTKEIDTYTMTVKLSCSTNDKEEIFYYHGNTLACLNCNGKTNMTGNTDHTENNGENGGNNNDSVAVPVSSNSNDEYSCNNWSNWTKTRVNNSKLQERTKTLVLGVKYTYTTKKVYSKWSDYTKTPIKESDNIEIETKIVNEDVWSETKTARHVTPSDRIRIINTRRVYDDANNCNNGFIENGVCYSNKTKVGNLTLTEYNSGRYVVEKKYCDGIKTLKNSEGKYVLTYVNCKYHEALDDKNTEDRYYTVYDYQELEEKEVVYYRYRVVTIVREQNPPIYTDHKYEEKDLPEGYIKVPGSEEVYYSYKYATCEK